MRRQFEDYVEMMLENESLEDFLERYNISAEEAVMHLYDYGMIDEDYGNEDNQHYDVA